MRSTRLSKTEVALSWNRHGPPVMAPGVTLMDPAGFPMQIELVRCSGPHYLMARNSAQLVETWVDRWSRDQERCGNLLEGCSGPTGYSTLIVHQGPVLLGWGSNY